MAKWNDLFGQGVENVLTVLCFLDGCSLLAVSSANGDLRRLVSSNLTRLLCKYAELRQYTHCVAASDIPSFVLTVAALSDCTRWLLPSRRDLCGVVKSSEGERRALSPPSLPVLLCGCDLVVSCLDRALLLPHDPQKVPPYAEKLALGVGKLESRETETDRIPAVAAAKETEANKKRKDAPAVLPSVEVFCGKVLERGCDRDGCWFWSHQLSALGLSTDSEAREGGVGLLCHMPLERQRILAGRLLWLGGEGCAAKVEENEKDPNLFSDLRLLSTLLARFRGAPGVAALLQGRGQKIPQLLPEDDAQALPAAEDSEVLKKPVLQTIRSDVIPYTSKNDEDEELESVSAEDFEGRVERCFDRLADFNIFAEWCAARRARIERREGGSLEREGIESGEEDAGEDIEGNSQQGQEARGEEGNEGGRKEEKMKEEPDELDALLARLEREEEKWGQRLVEEGDYEQAFAEAGGVMVGVDLLEGVGQCLISHTAWCGGFGEATHFVFREGKLAGSVWKWGGDAESKVSFCGWLLDWVSRKDANSKWFHDTDRGFSSLSAAFENRGESREGVASREDGGYLSERDSKKAKKKKKKKEKKGSVEHLFEDDEDADKESVEVERAQASEPRPLDRTFVAELENDEDVFEKRKKKKDKKKKKKKDKKGKNVMGREHHSDSESEISDRGEQKKSGRASASRSPSSSPSVSSSSSHRSNRSVSGERGREGNKKKERHDNHEGRNGGDASPERSERGRREEGRARERRDAAERGRERERSRERERRQDRDIETETEIERGVADEKGLDG
eukprot:Cvel_34020.t1-p1 / transcript=Cvel_34020.t1 / gene=Cvel_34020 / organism=Chromera_velia_CCMP2878 / gene_product=hypothetical protein / transcript_product=hypothetical protein / location=Cvel_scaffold5708:594-2976(+) / protein_length=794 / sequence_SO=supercontig / SO=protein_coding / is_pseudo=false